MERNPMAIDAAPTRPRAATREQALGWTAPSWAVLAGVTVLAGYLLLLPFVARTWRATGDEPHYLLAAHSLVNDADFDLANNYANLDYLNFYFSRDITPQVRLTAAGQQFLNHYPGLPLLIAPAYALGGRFGVLVFQSMVGALLAAVTFRLALLLSSSVTGSLLATLLLAFSPPLLFYNFLVYPELPAALLITLALYLILARDTPTPGAALALLLSLALLPWLNRRFVGLALLLALLALWSWRRRDSWRGLVTPVGGAALLLVLASAAGLGWLNNQFSAPVRADIIAPPTGFEFVSRWLRGLGWLVDQQRGLFIFAPIYALALWGAPALARRNHLWFVMLPFLAAMAQISLAGGFWIAWEVGPRFLVAVLPPLAGLLALAWRRFWRSKLWLAFAGALAALSLLNSWVVLTHFELPYKASLPIFYADKSGLPLPDWLPDMAGYARLSPPAGESAWVAPAGERRVLIDSGPLTELPFGHYRLTLAGRIPPGLPPDAKLLRLSVKQFGGGQVFNHTLTAADLAGDGQFTTRFTNPNPDRWRAPLVLHLSATGAAEVAVADVLFSPQPWYALALPLISLSALALLAAVSWRLIEPGASAAGRAVRLPPAAWAGVAIVLAIVISYVAYSQTRPQRVFPAAGLGHFVGHEIADPAASGGTAWLVDPAQDPPQKAIFGPFEIFDAGVYRVAFRLKLSQPVDSAQELARLQVNATANFDELLSQPIRATDFSATNLYDDLVLTVTNPRRQALSFEVVYLGVTPLAIDRVAVERVSESANGEW